MICRGLIFGVGLALPAAVWADPAPAEAGTPEVTNIVQLSRLGSQNPQVSYRIRLEGDILWANPAQGKFVLQDASGSGSVGNEFARPIASNRVNGCDVEGESYHYPARCGGSTRSHGTGGG